MEDRASYVTQVIVTIAKNDNLNVSVFTSVFWGVAGDNYREVLYRDINGCHSTT